MVCCATKIEIIRTCVKSHVAAQSNSGYWGQRRSACLRKNDSYVDCCIEIYVRKFNNKIRRYAMAPILAISLCIVSRFRLSRIYFVKNERVHYLFWREVRGQGEWVYGMLVHEVLFYHVLHFNIPVFTLSVTGELIYRFDYTVLPAIDLVSVYKLRSVVPLD